MDLELLKMTAFVNGISLLKLPLLAFVTPRVTELNSERACVRVNLGWRTRNHLGVMYFGSLAMGAELSIALKAVQKIQLSQKRIDFLFKDFQAQFLRRADGDVLFVCEEGQGVSDLIDQACQDQDRHEALFRGYAHIVGKPEEKVMTYALTLSVKNRSKVS